MSRGDPATAASGRRGGRKPWSDRQPRKPTTHSSKVASVDLRDLSDVSTAKLMTSEHDSGLFTAAALGVTEIATSGPRPASTPTNACCRSLRLRRREPAPRRVLPATWRPEMPGRTCRAPRPRRSRVIWQGLDRRLHPPISHPRYRDRRNRLGDYNVSREGTDFDIGDGDDAGGLRARGHLGLNITA